MMKRINIFLLMFAAVIMTAAGRTPSEVPNVHVADRTRFVSDPDNILSAEALSRVDSLLADVWNSTTAEPVVVMVGNLSGQDIDSYATELFELWGIGKKDKDNGVLVVVSRDDHQAVIRTGYGAEGVLNDARCGRILRDVMFPHFKADDYDSGVIDGVTVINKTMTHPEAADELLSEYANDADARAPGRDPFDLYLLVCAVGAAGMLVYLVVILISYRKRERYVRYGVLDKMAGIYLALSFLTLGMGLLAYLLLLLSRRIIREHPCKCPNCGHTMKRLDEQADNAHLTPAQDMEERLNSIDYDVWVCPKCGEEDILPYVNKQKNYKVCEQCGARAAFLESDRILQQPTTRHAGNGVKTYRCLNCGKRYNKMYSIAKLAAAVPPVIIMGGGRGGFGGGGGGFSGGSFGGGMTGGGGASGSW